MFLTGGSAAGTLALGGSRGAGWAGAAVIDEDRSARVLICSDQLKPSPKYIKERLVTLFQISILPHTIDNLRKPPKRRLSEVSGDTTIEISRSSFHISKCPCTKADASRKWR